MAKKITIMKNSKVPEIASTAIFNYLESRCYFADMITRRDRERERQSECRAVTVVVPGPESLSMAVPARPVESDSCEETPVERGAL